MGTAMLGAIVITFSFLVAIIGLAKMIVITKYGPITRKKG